MISDLVGNRRRYSIPRARYSRKQDDHGKPNGTGEQRQVAGEERQRPPGWLAFDESESERCGQCGQERRERRECRGFATERFCTCRLTCRQVPGCVK
jgi:hypothetical protein